MTPMELASNHPAGNTKLPESTSGVGMIPWLMVYRITRDRNPENPRGFPPEVVHVYNDLQQQLNGCEAEIKINK